MGGEPTIHSTFSEIYTIAQKYFISVSLFTNGLSKNLIEISPREKDTIIYNFNFINQIHPTNFKIHNQGNRAFEIQIKATTNSIEVFKQVKKLISFFPRPDSTIFSLTFDCTSNIFKNRNSLINNYMTLWNKCIEAGLNVSQDHAVPLCFSIGSEFPNKLQHSKCVLADSGIIDSNLNLRFCNQHPEILTQLLVNGRFIPWEIVENHLKMKYFECQANNLRKICKDCPLYGENCNGGCFIGSEQVDRESVLRFTTLPKT